MNGDGKITADGDRQIIGKNFPSWTTGLNLTLYYKDFDFSAMFQELLMWMAITWPKQLMHSTTELMH